MIGNTPFFPMCHMKALGPIFHCPAPNEINKAMTINGTFEHFLAYLSTEYSLCAKDPPSLGIPVFPASPVRPYCAQFPPITVDLSLQIKPDISISFQCSRDLQKLLFHERCVCGINTDTHNAGPN